jgi:hypothetical protein
MISDKTVVTSVAHTLSDIHTRSRLGTMEAASKIESGFTVVDVDVSDVEGYVVPKVAYMLSISAYDTFRVAIEDQVTGDIVTIDCNKIFVFHGRSDALFRIDRSVGQNPVRCTVVYA